MRLRRLLTDRVTNVLLLLVLALLAGTGILSLFANDALRARYLRGPSHRRRGAPGPAHPEGRDHLAGVAAQGARREGARPARAFSSRSSSCC